MSGSAESNSTANPYYNNSSRTVLVLYLAVLAIPVAIVMNSLMIIAFCSFKRLRITGMYIILNLAVSNFIATLLTVPIVDDIIKDLKEQRKATESGVWCDIRGTLDQTLFAVSALTLAASSLDRCWAVCHPFSYHKRVTTRCALFLIASIWAVSFLVSLLPVDFTGSSGDLETSGGGNSSSDVAFIGHYKYSRFSFSCGASLAGYYLPIYLIIAFFLPVAVVIISYSFILRVALSTIKKMGRTFKSVRRKSVSLRQPLPPEFHPTKKALKSSLRTLALVLVFGLSLVPTMLVSFIFWINRNIVTIHFMEQNEALFVHFFKVMTWVAHSVYALNPIVYGLMDRKFRNAYKTLLRCRGSHDEFRKEAQKQFYMDLADHQRRRTTPGNSRNNTLSEVIPRPTNGQPLKYTPLTNTNNGSL